MKILQVISSLDPCFGGPINAVLGLSSALVRMGHKVVIFTTDAGARSRLDVPLGIAVNIKDVKVYYFPMRYFKHYKLSPALFVALKRNIPSFDIVHIHSLFQFSTLAAAYFCRKYRKPHLIRPLGQLDPYALRERAFFKKIYLGLVERKNLEGAQAVHFTTDDERVLAYDLGLRIKSVVCGLGVDLEEFRALPEYGAFRSRQPGINNKKMILFLSRINFKKGLDVLVEAFADLSKKRNDVALVIAGPDNEGYGKKVISWVNQLGIAGSVVFAGMLLGRDRLAAFRDCDIFVLPSYSENFGLVILEAMACGVPVIISDKVNISPEILKAKAGLVVNTDPGQLSRAIQRLIEEPQLKQVMVDRARALVAEKFTWEIISSQLTNIYQAILAQPS